MRTVGPMKLFYSPGACSLASHIVLEETTPGATYEKVDLKTKVTETGANFKEINPKGYVPALQLDDGQVLTENMAVLQYLAETTGQLLPKDPMRRWRALEATAFVSTELHKSFKPLFDPSSPAEAKQKAKDQLKQRFALQASWLDGEFVMGEELTIVDAYLFVMLRWAKKFEVELPGTLTAYFEHLGQRPSVKRALAAEGVS